MDNKVVLVVGLGILGVAAFFILSQKQEQDPIGNLIAVGSEVTGKVGSALGTGVKTLSNIIPTGSKTGAGEKLLSLVKK